MLCEKCYKKEAVIRFTQIVGDEKSTLNLCQECAETHGLENPILDLSKVFGKLIVNILSDLLKKQAEEEPPKESVDGRCDYCGMTLQEFHQHGRLGCAHCYDAFHEELKVILRRLHGTNRHIQPDGKPSADVRTDSMSGLKKKLHHAIQREEYEKAAELRDRIRNLQHAAGTC